MTENQGWPIPQWGQLNASEVEAVFSERFSRMRLPFLHHANWSTDETELGWRDGCELLATSHHGSQAMLSFDGAIAQVRLEHGSVRAVVAGHELSVVDRVVEVLREWLPAAQPSEGNVPVFFWTYTPHGPQAITRKVSAHSWSEIAGNYARRTGEVLAEMMAGFEPSHGGQLILWQGKPGTGKTHALRALAWEWREWASVHYVVDPDKLFGEHADYLITVLLSDEDEGDEGRWKVLVLEDTGELLAADAKDRTGQGLSRLLNTVDGLIGQGLRVLVLVTTNDELKQLHPAVSRPGRCAIQLSFAELELEEARAWLACRGVDPEEARGSMPLAELFAVADGFSRRRARARVGFAA